MKLSFIGFHMSLSLFSIGEIKHPAEVSAPYAFDFTANNSCKIHSKTFKRSASKTRNTNR